MQQDDVRRGRYRAYCARNGDDLARVLALRTQVFRGGADDHDGFDATCHHVLIEDRVSGDVLCCFRTKLWDAAAVTSSYSAQFYDLAALSQMAGPMLELGRFCTDPHTQDPDIVRLAWGVLAGMVVRSGASMLMGCSSFAGVSAVAYKAAFAHLAAHHLAPAHWRPGVLVGDTVAFDGRDTAEGVRTIPALLRGYLALGGKVSDHAVIDRDLRTLHVFTGLEVAAIPPARLRALQAMAVEI